MGLELIAGDRLFQCGVPVDTFHMNVEEADIPGAIRSARGLIMDLHTCANNRGTPGQDNFDWKAIAAAIRDAGYDDYCVIESFTPDCKEIAKAASVWEAVCKITGSDCGKRAAF